ncbi:MAG: prepilin-type N-terminal cleavage/methylation domain-containing protein [Deltaproteobacteria bacterium]|nr:prepilin-type N-terminal cleavage/methylation domain-containing protein [Deltaproteobacteria bacterium]
MFGNKYRHYRLLNNSKGFSLIELAIVLIIIGIIIGAIVKGKDIIRGSEQKKIYTKFIASWQIAYATFYDRTGKILGDQSVGAAAGQDGQADTSNGASSAPTAAGQANLNDGPDSGSAFMGLQQVGISAPSSNLSNNYQYNYVDSAGGSHTLDVAFDFDAAANYNYMVIHNLPAELGIALDTMVDGSADGQAGDFLCYDDATDATNSAWGAAATEFAGRWKMQF